MSLTVKGLRELQAQIRDLSPDRIARAMATSARKSWKPVIDQAKALVPRDTGELADSLRLTASRPSSGAAVVVVGIKIGKGRGTSQARVAAAAFGESQSKRLPAARRWHFIELGTSRQPAHPFLRPALDSNAPVVLELLKKYLRDDIARALKKAGK